ncbi:MAG: hypothetical protein DYG89_39635 [Caldilinea sp. CFX5]|nr:hypothetical protein [Caldilinea sp. CFX5]
MIGAHLLLGILVIATFQDYLLPSLIELSYQVAAQFDDMDPALLDQTMALVETSAYQQSALTQQGRELAFHIFWCIMLYLGFNWVRILMGLSWLLASIGVIPLALLMIVFEFYHPFVILLMTSGVIYGIGGALLLFSPGVNTYMRMMRR